ncbi:MAG: hypothetical protein ACRDDM_02680 [Paraclostridium sp.]
MSGLSHSKAVSLEHTIRRLFNCDRFGFGGYIDSDMIEKKPMQLLALGLATVYNSKNQETKNQIDVFLEDTFRYEDLSIEQINEDEFETLINRFRELVG